MKLPLIVLSFFLLPLFSFCQINTSLDFLGGVDFSYRNLNASNAPSFGESLVLNQRNGEETGKLNLRFGFNFNKRVSEKIFFKTGLRFASVGYKGEEKTNLRWGNQQTGGIFDPNIPSGFDDTLQFINNYLFLEIPLVARFEFSQNKFTPFIELGLAPSLYLKSRNKLITESGSQISDDNNSPFNYSNLHFVGVVSFGGNYSINEGLQLFAQPTFRYHLTRLIKEVPIKENLWNVGLELGLRKKLN